MSEKKQQMCEVSRSFSYKMSLPKYENRDFFCAQKREVPVEEATKTSEELYEWCREEVMKSVKAYKLDHLEVPETREEVNKQLNKLEEDEYNEEKELKPF